MIINKQSLLKVNIDQTTQKKEHHDVYIFIKTTKLVRLVFDAQSHMDNNFKLIKLI